MVGANGRDSSALRAIRSFLERTIERIDENGEDLTPGDLRDMRDDAHTALLKMQTEDLTPLVKSIRAADVEKVEGDQRGALLFLKTDDGSIGPVWVIAPAVVGVMFDKVQQVEGAARGPRGRLARDLAAAIDELLWTAKQVDAAIAGLSISPPEIGGHLHDSNRHLHDAIQKIEVLW
jgi:hypothetical protein